MDTYKYPVYVTINRVTLAFNGPDLDPIAYDHERHPKDRDGYLEEYFLWKDGDTPTTHRLNNVNPSGHKIELDTRRTMQDTWRYRIYWDTLQFERKQNGPWEKLEPVSKLRIQLESEADIYAIDSISAHVNIVRIEHQGSTCSVTWNPATRRYQRTCQG